MAGGERDFLRRWSQRKHDERRRADAEAGAKAAAAAGSAPPPALPPVESLGFDSDFKAFMHAKVEEGVKRAALKKLFADPRFNVMDGLDVYIEDYSKGEILPDDMLAKLEHAKSTLLGPRAEEGAAGAAAPASAPAGGAEPEAGGGDGLAQAEADKDDGARG